MGNLSSKSLKGVLRTAMEKILHQEQSCFSTAVSQLIYDHPLLNYMNCNYKCTVIVN